MKKNFVLQKFWNVSNIVHLINSPDNLIPYCMTDKCNSRTNKASSLLRGAYSKDNNNGNKSNDNNHSPPLTPKVYTHRIHISTYTCIYKHIYTCKHKYIFIYLHTLLHIFRKGKRETTTIKCCSVPSIFYVWCFNLHKTL